MTKKNNHSVTGVPALIVAEPTGGRGV
jgi:hypothetical protein